jgi:hypothetical protein
MANGHDPSKPPHNPGSGTGTGGGVTPDNSNKPPQKALVAAAAAVGGIGGVVGAMIGSGMHH